MNSNVPLNTPLAAFAVLLISFSLFLIYRKVYLQNRQRDREAVSFPILKYFYIMVHLMQFVIFIDLSILSCTYLFPILHNISILSDLLSTFLLKCMSKLCQQMMALLAIQKFTIYFFPDTERYLKVTGKMLKYATIIVLLYYFLELLSHRLMFVYGSKSVAEVIYEVYGL